MLRDRAEAGQAIQVRMAFISSCNPCEHVNLLISSALVEQAAHRWCVSGTPLATPEDILAVLRFLRHQPFAEEAWARIVLLPALKVKTGRG